MGSLPPLRSGSWFCKPMRRCAITLLFAAALSMPASAKSPGSAAVTAKRDESPPGAAAISACLNKAARYHGVSADLLHAIAMVESGLDPAAVNRANANGSRDIGLMQINSSWLPRLATWDITEDDLFDPCVSAYVGAWILADNIARLGPVWRAVGAYNARSPKLQLKYARRIQRQLASRAGRTPTAANIHLVD